jgi:hypothetical protein
VPHHILDLQRRFDDAELKGDTELLRPLLADDFLSIGERGFILDKEQWIARHAEFRYLSLETTDLDVRQYDRAAIVRCAQRSRAIWLGTEMTLSVRMSQVWVEQFAGWALAAIQFSTLAET